MLHELFKDFVFKFNIRNGEDDLYNRSEIIRGHLSIPWQQQTLYQSGEIVSYEGVNYIVVDGQQSINEIPSQSYKWRVTNRAEWTMELDPNGYINRHNTDNYMPTEPGNPAVKRYVDNGDKQFYRNLNFSDGINFLPLDLNGLNNVGYINSYMPTENPHPANKKYVDMQIDDLRTGGSITVGNTLNSEGLGNRPANQFVTLYREFSGNYNGFAVKDGNEQDSINSTDWMRITANGLLPYKPDSETANGENSALGKESWKFSEIHALMINGTTVQKFQTETLMEKGDILSIGIDSTAEAVLYSTGGRLLGVVVKPEATGSFVATSGRVQVKLQTGQEAHRGDLIYGGNAGVATTTGTGLDASNYIGVCISRSTSNTDLIEIILK